MGYRDENDALRARVDQLEGDLAASEAKVARLEGKRASGEPQVTVSKLIGAPTSATIERVFDFEIDEAGYEAIAAVVRARLGVEVSQVGRSLTTPRNVFSMRRESGSTIVRVHGDWSSLDGAVAAVGSLSGLFGGLFSAGLVNDVAHASMLHLLWIVPSLAFSGAALMRGRAKTVAKQKLQALNGAMEAICEIAEQHRAAAQVRARVETAEETEEEVAAAEARDRASAD